MLIRGTSDLQSMLHASECFATYIGLQSEAKFSGCVNWVSSANLNIEHEFTHCDLNVNAVPNLEDSGAHSPLTDSKPTK